MLFFHVLTWVVKRYYQRERQQKDTDRQRERTGESWRENKLLLVIKSKNHKKID